MVDGKRLVFIDVFPLAINRLGDQLFVSVMVTCLICMRKYYRGRKCLTVSQCVSAVHYTMVDFGWWMQNLQSNIPGLFVGGES
jgi:hypothetical protein